MKKYGHEKAYSCQECSYTTARKHNLLQHMTLHTGIKPFKCDLCPYESNQKGHLNVHIRTHTREKPFKCMECPFASTVPKSLREHMTMHQGKRPLQCPYCSFSTSQPFSIKNHVALHEDTKLFKCKSCSYSTSIEKDFLTHRAIHGQSATTYRCPECTFTTPFKHQYDNHVISHGDPNGDIKDKANWDIRMRSCSSRVSPGKISPGGRSRQASPGRASPGRASPGRSSVSSEEKINGTTQRGGRIMKKFRSTSRKPLTDNFGGDPDFEGTGMATLPTGHINGHTDMVTNGGTEDLQHTAIADFPNHQKNLSSGVSAASPLHPIIKTEVITNGDTTTPPMPPPKSALGARRHPRIADAESSKLGYKLFKQDIIRKQMANTARFFCDYCARPFVEHVDWKRHVIRHFMMWPEIEG